MGMILYGLCQLPFIRRATIEVSAYKISDYLDKEIEKINKMTPFDFTMLKVKHKFSKWQYDKFERRILEKEGLWEYV